MWLTTSKEHVYDSISHYSSQYSSKTDMSTVWNFTRSIRSRFEPSGSTVDVIIFLESLGSKCNLSIIRIFMLAESCITR